MKSLPNNGAKIDVYYLSPFTTLNLKQTHSLQTKTIFELLHESSKTITSELELEKVVQRVTDIGTELVGAQFGAFFYNVINQNGEEYVLYTISGVEKEAFSKFPMPRNTKIFSPTFLAQGTVRYDDVTSQPHYGQNPPYHGMPKGHLPVKSYLAVPVVSTFTKEPIGGLFFGHSDVGVFTEESEKLIEGVAMQAAIAIVNARLFDEKKNTERKLLEQREQYKSIFNATFDSIII
ncbi:MAG: GAF domain-containing protein, partial [Chitinophagaceae bacterium]